MDKQTFANQVVPLASRLTSVAFGIVGELDTAADVVQEALLKLFLKRKELDKYRSIEALAIVTVKNLSIDTIRRRKHTSSLDDVQVPDESNRSNNYENSELAKLLEEAINALPRLQSLTFRLKEVEGYEVAEIAEITATTPEAVYNNLSRARSALRKQLLAQKEIKEYGIHI